METDPLGHGPGFVSSASHAFELFSGNGCRSPGVVVFQVARGGARGIDLGALGARRW